MKNKKPEKIVLEFKHGKDNMLIVSERRPKETKFQHEIRVEVMRALMIARSERQK